MKPILPTLLLAGLLASGPLAAENTLTVNLGAPVRPVTHAANGSLYGVTETIPADINGLVAPLNPWVFTAPAQAGKDKQQPMGAAIPVAKRLAGTSGKVMIRLADICPNWPYTFPGMGTWLKEVASVVAEKKASGVKNYYGYELWNEPNATWNVDNGDFEPNLWLPTYKKVRELDPGEPIVGPSFSEYGHVMMKSFLSFCIDHNCLPDIICWHELGGGGGAEVLADHFKDYRVLEKQLGIKPLKIAINEYCDPDHFLEGQPGSSARYIAKFERYQVDSACISWWFTDLPGRLGSLLTRKFGKPVTDAGQGGGWYFYQWYGQMTGQMVQVTPPNDDSAGLDGFANLSGDKTWASVCLGGEDMGKLPVIFQKIPFEMGTSVQVTVEVVEWQNKNKAVAGTKTLSTQTLKVENGGLTVPLADLKAAYGYRITLKKAP